MDAEMQRTQVRVSYQPKDSQSRVFVFFPTPVLWGLSFADCGRVRASDLDRMAVPLSMAVAVAGGRSAPLPMRTAQGASRFLPPSPPPPTCPGHQLVLGTALAHRTFWLSAGRINT